MSENVERLKTIGANRLRYRYPTPQIPPSLINHVWFRWALSPMKTTPSAPYTATVLSSRPNWPDVSRRHGHRPWMDTDTSLPLSTFCRCRSSQHSSARSRGASKNTYKGLYQSESKLPKHAWFCGGREERTAGINYLLHCDGPRDRSKLYANLKSNGLRAGKLFNLVLMAPSHLIVSERNRIFNQSQV